MLGGACLAQRDAVFFDDEQRCALEPDHHHVRSHAAVGLLYLSTEILWRQAVAGIIGIKSSHAMRINSWCMWRHREGPAQRTQHRHPPRAQPLRPCRSVTADVHDCPPRRGTDQAPYRIRDIPVAHTGGAMTQSPHHATGCDARPSLLFLPPGHGFSTLDARWKPLI